MPPSVDSHVVVDIDKLALLIRGLPRHDALGAAVIVPVGGRQHHDRLAVGKAGTGDPNLGGARSRGRARRAGDEVLLWLPLLSSRLLHSSTITSIIVLGSC